MCEEHSADQTLIIDGSVGEGGGQILRTALSLSMCLQRPIEVINIRAGRPKPGLMRAHLAAVRAAQKICNASLEGAELGSMRVRFAPGLIVGGNYRFAIGSAGSTTLLLQTLLPGLLQATESSFVTLEGGTHNPWAPSVDFVQQAFLRALASMGVRASVQLDRHGFYPAGGGLWQFQVDPWSKAEPLQLLERGALDGRSGVAKVALLPKSIADRELKKVAQKLGWAADELQVQTVESIGPGNILCLVLRFDEVSEVFESLGELRLPAERVANRAIRQVKRYLQADYPVGEYLADQLLLPMALGAGGCYRTGALSEHTLTNIGVIAQFLGPETVQVEEQGASHLIQVSGLRSKN